MKQRKVYKWLIGIIVLLAGMFVLSACGQGTPTPTPTETPTPSPTPSETPAPTVTPLPDHTYHAQDFGVTWSSSWYANAYRRHPPQQLAVDAGASWDRWAFEWNRIMDPRDGATPPVWEDVWEAHPNPSAREYSYNMARTNAQGTAPPLKVLGVLNNLISDRGAISFDSGGTWETFVQAVVNEYDDVVAAWEVGNEYGFIHESPGGYPPVTPENYAKALPDRRRGW